MPRGMKYNKYFIKTWGCQMNTHDSERIAGVLSSLGYGVSNSESDADIIVFNTCCVREHAELKVYGNLGRLKRLKEQNPSLIIILCGCMMQQKEVARHIAKRYPFVDMIIGTDKIHKIAEYLSKANISDSIIIDTEMNGEGGTTEGIPAKRQGGMKAWVSVMQGCDNYCSYCIVPYVRGREKSRKMEYILQEVKRLGRLGFKEVTLLGQNVNSYGRDAKDGTDFATLIRHINDIEGIERIRFMTSHPKDLSDGLILSIRDCDKVCEHIHLPFQAGSNYILQKMNRKYSREQYIELIERIRTQVPGISITTDIIVGFPGEREEHFQHTLDMVQRVRFDSAFTFLYSKRSGTPAAKMKEHVSENVKRNRLKRLLELTERIASENNDALKGKTLEVLAEGVSKTQADMLTGRTRTNKIVHFAGDAGSAGNLIDVNITDTRSWFLIGEKVSE